jgi:hypothetical protein
MQTAAPNALLGRQLAGVENALVALQPHALEVRHKTLLSQVLEFRILTAQALQPGADVDVFLRIRRNLLARYFHVDQALGECSLRRRQHEQRSTLLLVPGRACTCRVSETLNIAWQMHGWFEP